VHSFAIALSLFLLLYHQATTWIPLFPWNDITACSRKEIFSECAFNGLLMGTGAVCLMTGNSGFSHWYPLVYYPFLFLGECVDWWIPYFSASFAKARKIWDYDSKYGRTLKLLPHKPGQRTPDANHTVLHLATVATMIIVFFDRLSSARN